MDVFLLPFICPGIIKKAKAALEVRRDSPLRPLKGELILENIETAILPFIEVLNYLRQQNIENIKNTKMDIVKKYFSDFTPQQEDQLAALKDLYTQWNEKINVISRKDIDNFYLHHVLHSLTIATKFNFKKDMQVMDLGCGGGFPGVPLAIFFPETYFHMVDSINKKLLVIDEISEAIGLTNISTEHTRAEDIKNNQFDAVVSRAVAPLKDLWNWSKPLIRKNKNKEDEEDPNGLICLKGGDLAKEIFESGCKPFVWEIDKIFDEDYFHDKYLLYQPVK